MLMLIIHYLSCSFHSFAQVAFEPEDRLNWESPCYASVPVVVLGKKGRAEVGPNIIGKEPSPASGVSTGERKRNRGGDDGRNNGDNSRVIPTVYIDI